jgi:plasmid stabilization system protein ParE
MPISKRSETEKPGRASSFDTDPELRVSRIDHHYVFHLNREKQCPLILAVFHESMDLMTRLRARLRD